MTYVVAILAVVAGALVALQPGVNALLARHLASPFQAALISFSAGILVLIAVNAATGSKPPPLRDLAAIPWPLWVAGGAMGAIFVTASLWGMPKLGATAWIALVLAAQLATSLLMDQFGVLGLEKRPADPMRLIGVALLASGALLVVARR